jgi:hypothetical protein
LFLNLIIDFAQHVNKFLIEPCVKLAQNLWSGTRLALFIPTDLWQFRFGFIQLCLLLIVSFFLSFSYDYFDTSPNNIFNIYGLTYQATLYLLFFISVAIIAQIEKDMASIVNVMIIFLAVVPSVWGIYLLVDWLAEKQTWFDSYQISWTIFYLYLAWYLAIILKCVRKYYHTNVFRSVLLVTLYGIINYVPLFQLPQQPLWHADFSANIKAIKNNESINVENTFYRQNELVSQITESLLPERAGVTDLYFLGLAGYADEDVFMNEAKLAKQLFDDRFDTKDRSLLLINNSKTVKTQPLANAHNLESAVMAMAEIMNPEEDILFLMLTSHGSKDHKLSIDYYPLDMNDIEPGKIKNILDRSGIKWRVIVVSACYSGGFIDPLINENTLIMTASDKDKMSFGCGHDGDYTYFGEALFGKHLKTGRDLPTAFSGAKRDIETRETEEELEASMPQIRIGSNIEKHLGLLTDRLD